ncbi:hypothetical protein ACFYY8_36180 [Streptosporangium sp. NPDC001559]|uniref:hypothetical protein n=1 Tax=Streptosporangium sp. NPDC001559 TaxID=3366187 RepID=UPI0036E9471E
MAKGKKTAGHGQRLRTVSLPLVGTVAVPPPERLAFYAVLGVLGALEVIDWPVAIVVGVGHLLSEQHRSHLLQEAGEAAEAA